MPKMKTKRGAAKRFSKTGSGKIKRSKAFTSHILTKNLQRESVICVNPVLLIHPMHPQSERFCPTYRPFLKTEFYKIFDYLYNTRGTFPLFLKEY